MQNEESPLTEKLKKLYISNKTKDSRSTLAKLQSILKSPKNWKLYSSTDVLYIDYIFKAISQQKLNVSSFKLVASIVDSLMNLAKHCDIFKEAQVIANSTDSFLKNLDVIMNNINLQNSEYGEGKHILIVIKESEFNPLHMLNLQSIQMFQLLFTHQILLHTYLIQRFQYVLKSSGA